MESKASISLCMITKNEEAFLERCLNSVKDIVSEIIIVDSGSVDKTREIAKSFGAKVFDFQWKDSFAEARNESIRRASSGWILVLDADEFIDKIIKEKLKELVENAGQKTGGFFLDQISYLKAPFSGCRKNNLKFTEEYPFCISKRMVRLFRSKEGFKFRHRVHELVDDSLKEKGYEILDSGLSIHHLGSVKDEKSLQRKQEKYAKLILKQLEDDPNSARYSYYAAGYFMSMNDVDRALELYKKVAEIDPNFKLIFSDIAKAYLKKGNIERAIVYFRKSMKLHPENPSPANNLAVLLMQKSMFASAKTILEEQIEKNPDSKPLRINYQTLLEHAYKKQGVYKAG
ncbi:glycosyltransferase [Candidatus Woesearchaeota archaeon]|nr:glycosyltransferase [Candidatus Woesearchaeota archaeon]